jgi:osmotically-inducible protein OsmY
MKVALAALCALLTFAGCATTGQGEITDPEIKASIETALKSVPDLDLKYVTIDVHQRAVTLSGLVNDYNDRTRLHRLVREVPGVDQVIINVVIAD